MAWTRVSNEQRTHPQGSTVWSAGTCNRSKGRPQVRFKDSCKWNFLSTHIDINTWEDVAADRLSWRHAVNQGIQRAEQDRRLKHNLKRQKRKASSSSTLKLSTFICTDCTKDCHSRIGLYSHRRYYSKKAGRNP